MPVAELTREEVDERVAVLKRFRELLETQRRKFREYLTVLEKQQEMIKLDNVDAMVAHAEIEQSIVSEINTIQKVINPLEDMYHAAHPDAPDDEIPKLKTDLARLKSDVLAQNEKNRELLKSHMTVLRQQVVSLKNPYAKRTSVYATDGQTATRVDISQ
jgi:hypothetical protein